MQRKEFIRGVLATVALGALGRLATAATTNQHTNQTKTMAQELVSSQVNSICYNS